MVYLDSAATAQTPLCVLEAMQEYYTSFRANVHRGVYQISVEATERYNRARKTAADFLSAPDEQSIIFTRGTTESINLVMQGWARPRLRPGDKLVISIAEHHSNFVPWQQAAAKCGCEFICTGLDENEGIDEEALIDAIDEKTRLVAITALANGLGAAVDVARIARAAHAAGAALLVDAAQAAPHQPLDVGELDADFLAFSGHKTYGPTGVGVLYGKPQMLEEIEPLFYGGDMISSVSVERTTFNSLPHRLEAGTPNVAGVIGLGRALEFMQQIGWEAIQRHEEELLAALEECLYKVDGLRVLGPRGHHRALIAFSHPQIHPHDLSQYFDSRKVAVRAGHHCAQPLLRALGLHASTRASVGVYNTRDDIARFDEVLGEAIRYFS